MDNEAADIMISSISKNTMKQYLPLIIEWAKYCKSFNIPILTPKITDIIRYLTVRFQEGLSYGSLNCLRSALAFIIGPHLGSDNNIKRLFRGFYKLRPPRPKYNSTWDVSCLLDYIENNYIQQTKLEDMTKKTVTLLMLATGQRAQTMALININNTIVRDDCINIKIDKLIKTSGPNRYQPFLTIPFFNSRVGICPAKAVIDYINITKKLRSSDKLFISTKKPYRGVTSNTISRWVKNTMKECGIDINTFSAHSTRHAATSAAYKRGVNIDDIRRTAGWTGESTTFARFYMRPVINNKSFAEAIFKSSS
ncbi:uncharacterized protein LOC119190770 [Manduca sexta]|uniref:uncharacterized protein LOC119190770 n=1 Tax=Manduca sexta TaxID=7130 RepID=UPI00188F04B5|nr:uncharacterized protein LOC119190770 [Manduca sexta]